MATKLNKKYAGVAFGSMIAFLFSLLTGCNMPTQPSDINPKASNSKSYINHSCSELAILISDLLVEEKNLTGYQDKRIEDSQGHSVFYGWGKGDGMDTIELAKIRGQIGAAQVEQSKKKCH